MAFKKRKKKNKGVNKHVSNIGTRRKKEEEREEGHHQVDDDADDDCPKLYLQEGGKDRLRYIQIFLLFLDRVQTFFFNFEEELGL